MSVLTREIQAAEVSLVAQLAQTEATVEQLLSMRPGDFIELERKPRIKVNIDGIPAFECQYGTHNTKYAVKVDKTLLHRGESI